MDDTLRPYVDSVLRHKLLVGFAVVLAVAASMWAFSKQGASYTASVSLGPSRSTLLASSVWGQEPSKMSAITLVRLSSDIPFAERVVRQAQDPMPPAELLGRLTVQTGTNADVVEMQVTAGSSKQALGLAQAVADELIRSELAARLELANEQRTTLEVAVQRRRVDAVRLEALRQAQRGGMLTPEAQIDLERVLSTYGDYATRLDDLALSTSATSTIEVWQAPSIIKADVPNRAAFALVGLVVGVVVGGIGAFGIDTTKRRIDTASELSRLLRVPVLGEIPQAGKLSGGRERSREAWRLLRVRLVQALAEGDHQAVLLVPIAASKDAPLLARGLATSMARSGRSVAVVCADPTDGYSLQAAFGYGPYERGLADVVHGSARANDVLKATDVPGLWLVPTGDMSSGSTELVGTVAMRGLVTELGQRVEIVLVVTDSFDASADPVVALEVANRVVLLGDLGGTSRVAVRRCAALLAQTRADVLGLIAFESPVEGTGGDV
jgi:Mrp family chromosome partitioning ATPase